MYSPQIKYEFIFNSMLVRGDRFQIPSRRYSSKNHVENILEGYATGGIIDIYVDSLDSSKSVVLKPGFNYFFTFFLGLIAIVCIVSSVWLFHFAIIKPIK